MDEKRSRLLEILRKKSIKYGDFTLASGMKSTYYIDGKLTTLDPEGSLLLGDVVMDMVKKMPVKIDSIGGPTIGADPITTAAGISAFLNKDDIRLFIVRKKQKEHGRQKLVEGNFEKGDSVVIVEDVITTGGSIFQAIEAVEESGGKIEGVIVVVDRMQGGRENLEEKDYKLFPIFQIDEVLEK